jgi:hypothetical protein
MALIQAGIQAIEGDTAAALAGFRACVGVYRDLGLAWDEGLLGLVAASTLGVAEPEVARWLAEARATFERLKAAPLVDAADALAMSGHARRAGTTEPGVPARAQAEASSSST